MRRRSQFSPPSHGGEVGGVWYYYDRPYDGPPDYVSEVEYPDDGPGPGSDYVADEPVPAGPPVYRPPVYGPPGYPPPAVYGPPPVYVPPPVVCVGPFCVR